MGMVIFFVLSIAACVFLIYVLVSFHREVMRLEKKSFMHSLTYLGSYQNEPLVPESSFSVSGEQQPRDQLAARQGMLALRSTPSS
jgi:hypothetical protein